MGKPKRPSPLTARFEVLRRRRPYPVLVVSALGAAVQTALAQQLPTGGQVAAGNAVISQTGSGPCKSTKAL